MRPLVATVDLSAIRHNYALAKRCAPQRQAFAVVKANAYGHGAREVVTVRIPRHSDTQPTLIRTPVPRS
ncbi:alanine racemase, partial [Pseudomonas aeruginosa]